MNRRQQRKARAAKAFAKLYASHTDEQLQTIFDSLDKPENRVKSGRSKGCVKVRVAEFGDEILDELRRRRTERDEAALNDFNYVGSRHHY